jgi:hypothetical protein
VFHCFLGESVDDPAMARDLIMRIARRFKMPYFTLTPTFAVCPEHGYIRGEVKQCPTCGADTEIYSRIVGYFRPVKQWNKGKTKEFEGRKTFIPELHERKLSIDDDSRDQRDVIDRLSGEAGDGALYDQVQLPLSILS